MSALDQVTSRVAAIQNEIASLQGAPPSGTGAAFAQVLAGVTDPTGGTGASVFDAALSGGSRAAGTSGAEVVADAQRYLGIPYQWGGTDPATGLDCSGLVQRVYGDLGISLPRVAADQARQGVAIPTLADALPGDLVTFGSPAEHIGIYVGNGMMIDAPHTGTAVRIEPVGTPTSIRRIVGVGDNGGGYQALFDAASAKYGVPSNVLAAVANVESGDNPGAVSGAGAEGMMQIMPGTASSLGINPFDPAQAVDGAARILASNVQQFGSMPLALAAYNAGAGAVQRYGGIPPYAETEAYVQKVLAEAGQ